MSGTRDGVKASIYIRIDADDGTTARRVVEYESPKDGPWSLEVRNLADAFYVGETAKGMTADMLGGLAERTFSSPASRARRRVTA